MTQGDNAAPVTGLLRRWNDGDEAARDEALEHVYDELRLLARSHLRRERAGHSLETASLVNEAYLRLVDQHGVSWRNRRHFFGIAAQAMRRILVDHARRRSRVKRGGEVERVVLDEALHGGLPRPQELLALDRALDELAEIDPERARLVELRFFAGLTHGEIAELLDTSLSTIERRWRLARAFLHDAMA